MGSDHDPPSGTAAGREERSPGAATSASPLGRGGQGARTPETSVPSLIAQPALPIPARERALLEPQVAALAAGLADPALRARYATLLEELASGAVGASVGVLENLLEMGLQTGRFRQQYGPIDAQALYRLYVKTPRGQELAAALDGVNAGLASLNGQNIRHLTLVAKSPTEYDLAIETDDCQMTIAIGPGGVRVTSIELGV